MDHSAITPVPATRPASTSPLLGIPVIRRVLLATNFTDVCTEALRHAHSLLPNGGALRLLHVCPEPTGSMNPFIASRLYFESSLATAEAKSAAEEKFQALPQSLLHVPGVTISTSVEIHNDTAEAICQAAEDFHADIICMGTKGHSRTGVALLGSTVQAVLARAHCPVLAVRPASAHAHEQPEINSSATIIA